MVLCNNKFIDEIVLVQSNIIAAKYTSTIRSYPPGPSLHNRLLHFLQSQINQSTNQPTNQSANICKSLSIDDCQSIPPPPPQINQSHSGAASIVCTCTIQAPQRVDPLSTVCLSPLVGGGSYKYIWTLSSMFLREGGCQLVGVRSS